jgi:hypothetical protein
LSFSEKPLTSGTRGRASSADTIAVYFPSRDTAKGTGAAGTGWKNATTTYTKGKAVTIDRNRSIVFDNIGGDQIGEAVDFVALVVSTRFGDRDTEKTNTAAAGEDGDANGAFSFFVEQPMHCLAGSRGDFKHFQLPVVLFVESSGIAQLHIA